MEAVKTAKTRRQTDRPVILHTDQGIHFTCEYYKGLTSGMIRSYSKKGYPCDNAGIESFHSLIKREWLNRFDLQNYWQVYRLCDEYIEGFYNPVRIHSHCEYMLQMNGSKSGKRRFHHKRRSQKMIKNCAEKTTGAE